MNDLPFTLTHHSSFRWRGATYHLFREPARRRFAVCLQREYPEGTRWWRACGETWLEAVVGVLAQAGMARGGSRTGADGAAKG